MFDCKVNCSKQFNFGIGIKVWHPYWKGFFYWIFFLIKLVISHHGGGGRGRSSENRDASLLVRPGNPLKLHLPSILQRWVPLEKKAALTLYPGITALIPAVYKPYALHAQTPNFQEFLKLDLTTLFPSSPPPTGVWGGHGNSIWKWVYFFLPSPNNYWLCVSMCFIDKHQELTHIHILCGSNPSPNCLDKFSVYSVLWSWELMLRVTERLRMCAGPVNFRNPVNFHNRAYNLNPGLRDLSLAF